MFQTVPLLPRCTTTICMKVFLPCASLVRIVNLTEIGYDAFSKKFVMILFDVRRFICLWFQPDIFCIFVTVNLTKI